MLGLTIAEAMVRVSYREYMVRLHWLENQKNEPSRTDHYLMQIARYLDAIWAHKKKLEDLLKFKLPFVQMKRQSVPTPQSAGQQREAQSRTMWGATLGAIHAKRLGQQRSKLK